MKYVNIHIDGRRTSTPVAGVLLGERIYRVADVLATGAPVPLSASPLYPTIGDVPEWTKRLQDMGPDAIAVNGGAGYDAASAVLAPPIWPVRSFRDFYCFEQHVRTARKSRGLEMPAEWYEFPTFYFSNPDRFDGPDADVEFPRGGTWLDFECEIAAVIGKDGRNVPIEAAEGLIAGYTLVNDWSLRDQQTKEMRIGLGPAKGKDFASTLGPWLVTPDELESARDGKGYNLATRVVRNGVELSRCNWNTIGYSFAEMVVHGTRNAGFRAGDVIGSGTMGGGCIMELGAANAGGWLVPGDVIEISCERLGTLRNRIVPTAD